MGCLTEGEFMEVGLVPQNTGGGMLRLANRCDENVQGLMLVSQ